MKPNLPSDEDSEFLFWNAGRAKRSMMKRLKIYTISVVALVLVATAGYLWGVPAAHSRWTTHVHRRDVAAFVACVDEGTDSLVIVDAANDGVGVYVSTVLAEPQPEPYGERVQLGSPRALQIKARRDARSLERESERFTVLLGCLLKKVPWASYLKENVISVKPHWGWKWNHTDMSGELVIQVIFQSRLDMQGIVDAYAASPQAGHEWLKHMVYDEVVTIVDFTTVWSMGGQTEIPAGIFLFDDLPTRTVRIARLLSMQDTKDTELPGWYVTPTPVPEPTATPSHGPS